MKPKLLILAALFAAAMAPAGATQLPDGRSATEMHGPAGAYFPVRVGDFRRSDVHRWGANGDDMGVTYRLVRPDGQLVLTVYIYPAARIGSAPGAGQTGGVARAVLCNQEFDQVRAVIMSQNRDADMSEEGGAPAIDGVDAALSRRTVYHFIAEFSGRRQEVRSEVYLYCFVGGDWLVKYRATSNGDFDAAGAIERFIRSGPWPGRTPPPAPDEIVALPRPASAPAP